MLKLSCGAEFGQIAAQRWVHGYLARYPQVSVEADFTSRLIDLVHEGFDLAIRVGTLPDSSLAARRLGELRYGLYASPGYLARQGSPQAPGELLQHALLAFNAVGFILLYAIVFVVFIRLLDRRIKEGPPPPSEPEETASLPDSFGEIFRRRSRVSSGGG